MDTKIQQLYWFLVCFAFRSLSFWHCLCVCVNECYSFFAVVPFVTIPNKRRRRRRPQWRSTESEKSPPRSAHNFICVSFLLKLINFLLQSMEFVRHIEAYLWHTTTPLCQRLRDSALGFWIFIICLVMRFFILSPIELCSFLALFCISRTART